MAFQVIWLKDSRALIQEQFDQKVNLAMGSALTDYNAKHKTNLNLDDLQNCDSDQLYKFFPVEETAASKVDQKELISSLGFYMSFYGIDEKYKAEVFENSCQVSDETYCCALPTKTNCVEKYSLGVSFISREDYLSDQMRFMIISSVLIFLLLAAVSFYILRALIKQKRITRNNIDFFNNTAHELKTPLTNITLAINLLSKKNEAVADSHYSGIIKSESSKLKKSIERVLYLSKLESGEHQINSEPVDLKEILSSIVQDMNMRTEARGGKIHLSMPSGQVIVQGDHYHLSNVVCNLIDNALKYCDSQPEIRVDLTVHDDQVTLNIADNGIGISKSDQQHIFEKFQRVNTGDIREATGFGIGLSYVKKIVEMHKGLIQVHSELKKGSEFKLTLPKI